MVHCLPKAQAPHFILWSALPTGFSHSLYQQASATGRGGQLCCNAHVSAGLAVLRTRHTGQLFVHPLQYSIFHTLRGAARAIGPRHLTCEADVTLRAACPRCVIAQPRAGHALHRSLIKVCASGTGLARCALQAFKCVCISILR